MFERRYIFVMHHFVSILVLLVAGCFAIIVLQMYFYCECSVSLPHGAVGLSAVCDCGIS